MDAWRAFDSLLEADMTQKAGLLHLQVFEIIEKKIDERKKRGGKKLLGRKGRGK